MCDKKCRVKQIIRNLIVIIVAALSCMKKFTIQIQVLFAISCLGMWFKGRLTNEIWYKLDSMWNICSDTVFKDLPIFSFPFLLWAVTWICIKGTDSRRTVTECKKYYCFSRAETMILCGFFKPLKYNQSVLPFFPRYAKISHVSRKGQVGEIILHILQCLSKTQEQRV